MWRGRFIDWVYLPSSGKVGGIIVAWDTRVIKVEESLLLPEWEEKVGCVKTVHFV